MEMNYVYIFMSKSGKGVFNTLVISDDKLIINNINTGITDLESIECEITGHTRLENLGESQVYAELLPVGSIKFKIKNREEVVVNSINPFVIAEDLVLKLNNILDRNNESKFYLKESSVYRIIYSRI